MNTSHSLFVDTVWADFCAVKTHSPLIHNVTNLVVTAFNANVLLAAGASPIMAHALEEVADMVRLSGAVVVNIGTLDAGTPIPIWRDQAIAATRQLAKRQLTWLRSMPTRHTIACDGASPIAQVLQAANKLLAKQPC